MLIQKNLNAELAEMLFATKMCEAGYVVSKPLSNMSRYDFIVDTGKERLRIQVKSTWTERKDGKNRKSNNRNKYKIQLKWLRHKTYKQDDFDILVCYIGPEKIWYLFPSKYIIDKATINLYPKNNCQSYRDDSAKYEIGKEKWIILTDKEKRIEMETSINSIMPFSKVPISNKKELIKFKKTMSHQELANHYKTSRMTVFGWLKSIGETMPRSPKLPINLG